jgi:uncharacterized SAM-binding protein YcdF (DUF218 family)
MMAWARRWSSIHHFAIRRVTVWKTTWRLRLTLAATCGVLFGVPAPFWAERVGSSLVAQDALERADVVIADVTAWPSIEVLEQAARLYRAGYAGRMLLTRYVPNDRLDAAGIRVSRRFDEVLRIYTRELDLRDEEVETIPIEVSDPVTLNTARQVAAHCESQGVRSAILVTSLFHSRRSALSFRQWLEPHGVKLISRPVESGLRVNNWWRTKDGLRTVLQESVQLAYYRFFVL